MDHLQSVRANLFVTLGFSKWHCSVNNLYYLFLPEQHEHDDEGIAEGLTNATLYRLWVYKTDNHNILQEYRDNDAYILFEKGNSLFLRVDDMEFRLDEHLDLTDTLTLEDPVKGKVTFTRSD